MLFPTFHGCSCVCRSPSLSNLDRLGETRLLYSRSAAIAERHDSLLGLIHRGGGSATALAEALGVSPATINRDLSYLRSKGHPIRARRSAAGWSYAMDAAGGTKRATSEPRA
ncbi:helix-turn-helix domain-containing protein [Aurantiacibacter hainanensis]|uniref:helix-turn-helix domain-containing protein n=1 Tax=Aurantiacibacter hainanensis TaxID=3076114 RepID=UPI0033657CFE